MLMGGIDLAIGATVSLACVLAATLVGDSLGAPSSASWPWSQPVV